MQYRLIIDEVALESGPVEYWRVGWVVYQTGGREIGRGSRRFVGNDDRPAIERVLDAWQRKKPMTIAGLERLLCAADRSEV